MNILSGNGVLDSAENKAMSDEEIKNALNIPERNTEDYPEISKETQVKAGSFLYKLNLLASSADGNLQSIIWTVYDKMDDFIRLNKKNASLELAMALEILKDYIQDNKNIIFNFEEGLPVLEDSEIKDETKGA